MGRRLLAAGRLQVGRPATARVVCRTCELVGDVHIGGAALYLSGVHNQLHHGGSPIAEVEPACGAVAQVPAGVAA